MRFSRILFAASIGVALAAACGGSSVSNSVGSDGGGSSSSSGAGSSSTGSSSGTASGGGTGSGSGAGGSSGFIVTDSGAIAPTGVPCGNTANNLQIYCTGSQACCTTISPPEGGRGPTLVDQNCVADQSTCPAGGFVMACMGSINCPGKVCCLEPGDGGAMGGGGGFGGGAVANSLCESACSATGVQICLTDTDCPTGQTCTGNRAGFTTCAVPPCTGSASCAGGEICCTGIGGGGRANSCQATCPMGSMQVCMANADCPAGQTCNMIGGGMGGGNKICGAPPCTAGSCGAGMVCCEGRAGGIAACAPAGAMGCNVICATAADCAPGQTCTAGAAAGAPMTCVTPPCTHGSCAAGEICCTTGGGAACVATDAGTCPMGRLVCATAADCPAGNVCMAAGGGMILSCRAPMMMPPAMDAGAMMTPMDAGGGD